MASKKKIFCFRAKEKQKFRKEIQEEIFDYFEQYYNEFDENVVIIFLAIPIEELFNYSRN